MSDPDPQVVGAGEGSALTPVRAGLIVVLLLAPTSFVENLGEVRGCARQLVWGLLAEVPHAVPRRAQRPRAHSAVAVVGWMRGG